ncbi:hypothetical protein EJB05_38720, partial [Eragrostis curvula]
MADASSERTASAPQKHCTGSPTKAQQLRAASTIPESMDHWKPGEIDEKYIAELRSIGWISDFVVTQENKGSMCFSFDTTEIPVFESHLMCGFNLPPSDFLERVCKYYNIELIHLKPQAIALLSIFSTLCECWLGTACSLDLWRVYHEPRYYSSGLVGCVSFNLQKNISYPPFKYRRSWSGFRWRYFIMDDSSKHSIKGKGLLPYHQGWNKSVPVMDERLKHMTAKVTELASRGLRGEHIVEEYIRRCFYPLQRRESLAMFGDGPRNPKWLPAEVADIPKDVVEKRVWAILEAKLQPKPENFPIPYSATNPADKSVHHLLSCQDMFGRDPSEGGAKSVMVLDSSSSEKEPRESPKKSSAEAFADTILNSPDVQDYGVDLQSLEEKVDNLKTTRMSNVAPKSPTSKPTSSPKSKPPPKSRSSKPKPSEEPIKTKVQPARKRKLKSPATTLVTSSTELPPIRGTPNPVAKRPCIRAPGDAGTADASTPVLQAPSGTPPSGLGVFGKIVQEVQAAEAWHMKTCKAYSSKVNVLQQENKQLQQRLSESAPSPALTEKDAKISQLEADLEKVNQALAESRTTHASEVESLQGYKSKLLEEKLALKEQDLQSLRQEVSALNEDKEKLKANKEEAVEEGYARCIAGSAYTLALFKHHLPHLDLAFVKTGFQCDAVQRDMLVDQVHVDADSFVTALQLIPDTTPAEGEAPVEEETPAAEDDTIGKVFPKDDRWDYGRNKSP